MNNTVLVVDDQDPIRNLLKAYLTGQGYEVITAPNGQEAYEKLSNDDIDTVISDIVMEPINGEELFYKINEFYPQTNVYMMSGGDHKEMIDRMIEDGAKGFIRKPFELYKLLETIKSYNR